MKRLALALTSCSMAIVAAIACSSSLSPPDSETHWINECNVDADCEQGVSCLCNICTRPCGGKGCAGIGTRAACIAPSSELSDACHLAPGVAFCAEACRKDADCSDAGAGLRCIDGGCFGGAPTSDAGRMTTTSDAGRNSGRMTSISTWVADLVDAYCTWAIRCGTFPDEATCHASKGHTYVTEGFNSASAAVTAVSKGTAEFDATAATACLATLSELDCGVDFWARPRIPAPCMSAFSGHVSDGGTCIDDVECGEGAVCLVESTVTCGGTCTSSSGSCRMDADCPGDQYCDGVSWWGPGFWGSGRCDPIVPPGAANEPCGRPVQCAPGFSCFGGPAPALCRDPVGITEGESCGPRGPGCAVGLTCVESDDGTTSTCVHAAKLGEPCTSLFQCGAQYLMNDLICDVTGSHTCIRRPASGSCIFVKGTNTCDPVTSYCVGSGAVGTCKPWLSVGDACVFPTNGFDPCGSSASCQGSGTAARCVSTIDPVCTPK